MGTGVVDIVAVPCSSAAVPRESVLSVIVCDGRYRLELCSQFSAEALRAVLDVLEAR
jgi:hypothetical protein